MSRQNSYDNYKGIQKYLTSVRDKVPGPAGAAEMCWMLSWQKESLDFMSVRTWWEKADAFFFYLSLNPPGPMGARLSISDTNGPPEKLPGHRSLNQPGRNCQTLMRSMCAELLLRFWALIRALCKGQVTQVSLDDPL